MEKHKLSVVIIALNEEKNILRCLESVKPVANEIVVVDSGSSDRTAEICREFGCRVLSREFDGYGQQKQFAVDQAVNNWVLSIDADEVLSDPLQNELREIFFSDPASLQSPVTRHASRVTPSGYQIPFRLHYLGRILKHGGVGHEMHLRLFDRTRGRFTTVPVHEGIECEGVVERLKNPVIHYSYRDISHHLEKINTYTSQAAQGYKSRGRSFSRLWVAVKFPATFISCYFIKLGILDGYQGFMWSFFAAMYATVKVAKTIELTSRP